MRFSLQARMRAEFVGAAFLLAAVVGSGIMGERLAGGNVAIALLANTIATAAALDYRNGPEMHWLKRERKQGRYPDLHNRLISQRQRSHGTR